MSAIPRVVVSAPSSGHGKTAISVGLLAAVTERGYRAVGFKIGPDQVDAAYLGLAARRPGRDLDPRLVGAARIGPLLAAGAAALELAVVEGTMGLFDGLAGRTDSESTAQVAGSLRAAVVLVVDVGAMGQSVAAPTGTTGTTGTAGTTVSGLAVFGLAVSGFPVSGLAEPRQTGGENSAGRAGEAA